MHRFFLEQHRIRSGECEFPDDLSFQIHRVLRLKPGMLVMVLDNLGFEYPVELSLVNTKGTCGRILMKQPARNEPPVSIRLFLSLCQREKFEWMLQKCTEVGAVAFVPLVTERTLAQNIKQVDAKQNRWRQIIREAAEQSERGRIPSLEPLQNLKNGVVKTCPQAALKLIAWEKERSLELHRLLADTDFSSAINAGEKPLIDVMIGPEGGFSEAEVQALVSQGFRSVSLGKRILRMETAAMVAAALILYEMEKTYSSIDGESV